MTNMQTTTTKTINHLRALMALAALAVLAGLLLGLAARPAQASTTFTVNSTSDMGDPNPNDGQCVIPDFSGVEHCTLRAAIQNANGTPGADTIKFDIPSGQSKVIAPGSFGFTPLPAITEQVTIDGYTQPGAHPNTQAVGDDAQILVGLSGGVLSSDHGFVDGLVIDGASNCVIRGLAIYSWNNAGVKVSGATAQNNRIEGNYVGLDASGSSASVPNERGVDLSGAVNTTVGGTSPAARNIISSSLLHGVILDRTTGTKIQGNYIGTDRSGTQDRGNRGFAIFDIQASNTLIGGTTTGAGNVISGNDQAAAAVNLSGEGARVLGNRIGTTASGAAPLGNAGAGIEAGDATGTSIGNGTAAGSNTIAFNGRDGITVFTTGNRISGNSIFSNAGMGVDLLGPNETGTTNVSIPNDLHDVDTGANNLQNFPVLTSAASSPSQTRVQGSLHSIPSRTFSVEFFSNPLGADEGKTFLGQTQVTTSSSGDALFNATTARAAGLNESVTATATDLTTHDTSEFSAPLGVTEAPNTSPTITGLKPGPGTSVKDRTPTIGAKVTDAESELLKSNIVLRVDGTSKSFSYDQSTDRLSFTPKTNLPLGKHTVKVVAKDQLGAVGTRSWSFSLVR